jgi:hypothetical protein
LKIFSSKNRSMGGQFPDNHSPQSAVIRDLETKLADSTDALAELYQKIRQDAEVILALRYLTLAVIASKLNLYAEHRSAAVLVDEISQQMNAADPNRLLTGIRYLKLCHPAVYQLNPDWFARAATSAVDCINRAIVRRQTRHELTPPHAELDFDDCLSGLRTSTQLRFDPENPPQRLRSFNWMRLLLSSGAVLSGGIALGVAFNFDRFNFSQIDWAVANPQSQDTSVAVVATAPSPSPSAVNDSTPSSWMESHSAILPLPTVGSSTLAMPGTAQPAEQSSQFITSQLSAPFYQKVVRPAGAKNSDGKAETPNAGRLDNLVTIEQRLQKICAGQLQICNYKVAKNQTITVTLLPGYTSKVQAVSQAATAQNDDAAKIALAQHVQSLDEALSVIGKQSSMPLSLYGSDGKLLQKYPPQAARVVTKN